MYDEDYEVCEACYPEESKPDDGYFCPECDGYIFIDDEDDLDECPNCGYYLRQKEESEANKYLAAAKRIAINSTYGKNNTIASSEATPGKLYKTTKMVDSLSANSIVKFVGKKNSSYCFEIIKENIPAPYYIGHSCNGFLKSGSKGYFINNCPLIPLYSANHKLLLL